jgi:hypothetical protein
MILSVWLKKIFGLFKNKKFIIFVATKIGRTKENFPPLLLVQLLDPGSWMDKNQNPGYGMNILDSQH